MSSDAQLPGNVIIFGPDGNCTLDLCPIEWSVYKYQPNLAANIIFIVIYAIAMGVHVYLGFRWRAWWYMVFMMLGCIVEIIGYIGRILMHYNPFSFPGFMIQIVFVTSGPVFYTAAIYVTLAKTIQYLAPEVSRIKPNLIWWIFIPADMVCLTLQAAGGALSTVSEGSSQNGVDIAMAGLALQVIVLFVFCVLMTDYLIRYFRSKPTNALSSRMRLFFGFLAAAVLMILGRCAYRCYELSEGYQDSTVITDEGLFIGLEGVLIIIAVFCLCIGHPGFVFNEKAMLVNSRQTSDGEGTFESK
ncbi:hypothetical protein G7Z17_g4242 [Cylindrodendrum hubeiense]|uniref:Sphingoid long-chain base transporter RSB1 n=1 Tax=Cylindrodendrum hubeiense TaxID=595255 RepID=A0A9P5LCU1_9HYPO|nr:hypothetical protein G7Z17_g4242 [Cylindrodendrum hubeiense]